MSPIAIQPAIPRRAGGFTVLELLVSMALLTVMLVLLAQALETSLGLWRRGAGGSDLRGETRGAMEWLRRDLSAAVIDRPAALPPLPATVPPRQREMFGDRWLMPMEINRASAADRAGGSFLNAEPGFDQLAFVIDSGDAGAALVGYYVAYARDSPLATSDKGSLKLFRHHRPGGSSLGDGHSRALIMAASEAINDQFDEREIGSARAPDEHNPAAARRGVFTNGALPFLLGKRVTDLATLDTAEAAHPWPTLPPLTGTMPDLAAPPATYPAPEFTTAEWEDPEAPIHDYLFPDEAVAHGVVAFRCRAYRRIVFADGNTELLDAAALNAHLGLPDEEWPALVRPDFVEVTLGLIPPEISARLRDQEEWTAIAASPPPWVENAMKTLRLRLPVGPTP